jgi:protein tyrosine/serine phosphatase
MVVVEYGGGAGGHRAAWATVVVLLALGVSEYDILKDYTAHTKTITKAMQHTRGNIATAGRSPATTSSTAPPPTPLPPPLPPPLLPLLLHVPARNAAFIRAGLHAVTQRHGTVDGYLTHALRLTESLRGALQRELLE